MPTPSLQSPGAAHPVASERQRRGSRQNRVRHHGIWRDRGRPDHDGPQADEAGNRVRRPEGGLPVHVRQHHQRLARLRQSPDPDHRNLQGRRRFAAGLLRRVQSGLGAERGGQLRDFGVRRRLRPHLGSRIEDLALRRVDQGKGDGVRWGEDPAVLRGRVRTEEGSNRVNVPDGRRLRRNRHGMYEKVPIQRVQDRRVQRDVRTRNQDGHEGVPGAP